MKSGIRTVQSGSIVAETKAEGISNAMMTDLEIYKAQLVEAAHNSSNEVFTNPDNGHAIKAFSVLFDNTTHKISLLAKDFNGDISNNPEYVDSLKKCLLRNVEVEILTLETPKNSEGFNEFLKYKASGKKVTIKKASEESKKILDDFSSESLLYFGQIFNLQIFDDNKYRIEYNPDEYSALLSFSDKEITAKYYSKFKEAFLKADIIA